MKSTNMLP